MGARAGAATGALVVALGLVAAVADPHALAAGGDRDPTFGDDGLVTTDFLGGDDVAHAVAIQRDGRIVVAGSARPADAQAPSQAVVARYLPDGSLDATFSLDGVVLLPGDARALAIQDDGRIVVAGTGLTRLLPDGSLDEDFGSAGQVLGDFATTAIDVALQGDGRIVVAADGVVARDFVVARYRPDGSQDTAFAGDGVATTDLGGSEVARGLAIDAKGRVVVVGVSGRRLVSRAAIARYRPNGTLDAAFAGDGSAILRFPGNEWGGSFSAVAVRRDGRIVVGGNDDYMMMVARYRDGGRLDTSFGGDGTVLLANSGATNDLAIERGGKVVVGGFAYGEEETDRQMVVSRMLPDGVLDRSFSDDGVHLVEDFGFDSTGRAVAVRRGRIVVAGRGGSDLALLRLVGGPHQSRITLAYRDRTGEFVGDVATAGPATCDDDRLVVILRERRGEDPLVAHLATDENGEYAVPVADPRGRFYAVVPRRDVGLDFCSRDTSEIVIR